MLIAFDDIIKTNVFAPVKEKKNKKIRKENGKSTPVTENGDEPPAIQIFVDLMISVLTRSSGSSLFLIFNNLIIYF